MCTLPWLQLLLLATAASAKTRQVQEKTPHPCKAEYDTAEVSGWVETHLQDAPTGRDDPRLLLLLGGSGAGKGTFISAWRGSKGSEAVPSERASGFVFHGLDEYLVYIPEYQLTLADTDNVYKDAADACYGGAAIPAAKRAGVEIINKKIDLIYEETGKSVDRIKKRVLPPFVDAGYKVTVVLIHNEADIAIERSAGRFQLTGRYAADDYIRGTFQNNKDSYQELKKHVPDAEFVYCDNTGHTLQCWADGAPAFPALIPEDILASGAPKLEL